MFNLITSRLCKTKKGCQKQYSTFTFYTGGNRLKVTHIHTHAHACKSRSQGPPYLGLVFSLNTLLYSWKRGKKSTAVLKAEYPLKGSLWHIHSYLKLNWRVVLALAPHQHRRSIQLFSLAVKSSGCSDPLGTCKAHRPGPQGTYSQEQRWQTPLTVRQEERP